MARVCREYLALVQGQLAADATIDAPIGRHPRERTMIEDRLYQAAENDWFDNGPPSWDRWRLAIYAPPGDMKRSTHLDSRGAEPKWPNVSAEVPA